MMEASKIIPFPFTPACLPAQADHPPLINAIPPRVLGYILSKLDDLSFKPAMLTCRRFHATARLGLTMKYHNLVSRTLGLGDPPVNPPAYEETTDILWLRKGYAATELPSKGDDPTQAELEANLWATSIGEFQRFTHAAKMGSKSAHLHLKIGYCLLNGYGTEQNEEEARSWLSKASELGSSTADYLLGLEYLDDGVAEEEAFAAFQRASAAGHLRATVYLGTLYEKGVGQDQRNPEAAFRFHEIAAQRGDPYGMYELGLCYFLGTPVLANLRIAAFWLRRAAAKGYHKASIHMGLFHANDSLGAPSPKQAFQWFVLASKQGSTEAFTYIGRCYENGFGIEQDLKQAYNHYALAAERGDSLGTYHHARCLDNGIGIDHTDILQAFNQYLVAGSVHHVPEALERLGVFYRDAIHIDEPDYDVAFRYFTSAVDYGSDEAKIHLAKAYLNGQGVEKSETAAIDLLIEAEDEGVQGASELLSQILPDPSQNGVPASPYRDSSTDESDEDQQGVVRDRTQSRNQLPAEKPGSTKRKR